MKYEIAFSVYARMIVEIDSDEEKDSWIENFGDIDHPFEIEHPDSVYMLDIKEIEDGEEVQ